jgi:hypothetical protein
LRRQRKADLPQPDDGYDFALGASIADHREQDTG